MQIDQLNLFANTSTHSKKTPLAFNVRPKSLAEYVGQKSILLKLKNIKHRSYRGIILYGPPGSGKTTLAHLLALELKLEIFNFNAVLGGVQELRKLIDSLIETKKLTGKSAIIFIDEIHRFNKSQQDALLPFVEAGEFLFIGATTEYPQTSINRALLSRSEVLELKALTDEEIIQILQNACINQNINLAHEFLQTIAKLSNGDARLALSGLEIALELGSDLDPIILKKRLLEQARSYDKNSDRHYDVISAFIKSMRGSDVNSALLWLAVMLDGGEDPKFIARRLLIFASEDIGLADANALLMANAAMNAAREIGMPEVRINLAHVTSYLALAPKNNKSYKAINEALEFVRQQSTIEVPSHLKSRPPINAPKYLYPHDYENQKIEQTYSPFNNLNFLN